MQITYSSKLLLAIKEEERQLRNLGLKRCTAMPYDKASGVVEVTPLMDIAMTIYTDVLGEHTIYALQLGSEKIWAPTAEDAAELYANRRHATGMDHVDWLYSLLGMLDAEDIKEYLEESFEDSDEHHDSGLVPNDPDFEFVHIKYMFEYACLKHKVDVIRFTSPNGATIYTVDSIEAPDGKGRTTFIGLDEVANDVGRRLENYIHHQIDCFRLELDTIAKIKE